MLKIKSLNKQLERSFRKNWWRPALSNYKGETMNYAMLAERIAIIHANFAQFGVKPGDKIAICGRNQANWGVAFLAAMTYGAVPVPLLHDFNPANIVDLINHAEARAFFVDEAIWDKLDHSKLPDSLLGSLNLANFRVLGSIIPDLAAERSRIISEFHTKYASGLRPEDLDYYKDRPDDLALINYTSGTSGFSKGVMIPYRALIANIEFADSNFTVNQADSHIAVSGSDFARVDAYGNLNRRVDNASGKTDSSSVFDCWSICSSVDSESISSRRGEGSITRSYLSISRGEGCRYAVESNGF